MRQRELIPAHPVVSHQKPASETLAGTEACVCRSRLADLNQKSLDVQQKAVLHLWPRHHDAPEVLSREAQRFAWALDDHSVGSAVASEHDRDANQALAASHSDFHGRVGNGFGDSGGKPLLDEIDELDLSIWKDECVAMAERDWLQVGMHEVEVVGSQCTEYAIAGDQVSEVRHALALPRSTELLLIKNAGAL
ncbi:MAG: hypothetical protein ACJ8DU_00140 [Microvirga sp.]